MVDDTQAQAAMTIILAAGNAREKVFQAITAATGGDFDGAADLIAQAQQEITRAHKVHTDHIQAEAGGVETPYSLLFTHAQDTLMTAYSEFRLVKKLNPLFAAFDARLRALEEKA